MIVSANSVLQCIDSINIRSGTGDTICDTRQGATSSPSDSPHIWNFASATQLDLVELIPSGPCKIGGMGVRRIGDVDYCAIKSSYAITVGISGVQGKS